jgi:hypothetical protein
MRTRYTHILFGFDDYYPGGGSCDIVKVIGVNDGGTLTQEYAEAAAEEYFDTIRREKPENTDWHDEYELYSLEEGKTLLRWRTVHKHYDYKQGATFELECVDPNVSW